MHRGLAVNRALDPLTALFGVRYFTPRVGVADVDRFIDKTDAHPLHLTCSASTPDSLQ